MLFIFVESFPRLRNFEVVQSRGLLFGQGFWDSAGAKKEDVGVNWDVEKSELSIAGVVYRPADEELLKLLDVSERKVGPFERKIRLGTRANSAQIDSEGITAKLEDGVLRIEVPKLEKEGFVEVRKVDIE